MAAVAGAVAQELIACYERPGIERAWVNNGGDIALHLAPGQSARVGLFADLARFDLRGSCAAAHDRRPVRRSHAELPVRGVATSGWRGRSFSLGIADSVTVLARHRGRGRRGGHGDRQRGRRRRRAASMRRPASECKDDSDLGDIPVTVDVPSAGARAGAPRAAMRARRAPRRCSAPA